MCSLQHPFTPPARLHGHRRFTAAPPCQSSHHPKLDGKPAVTLGRCRPVARPFSADAAASKLHSRWGQGPGFGAAAAPTAATPTAVASHAMSPGLASPPAPASSTAVKRSAVRGCRRRTTDTPYTLQGCGAALRSRDRAMLAHCGASARGITSQAAAGSGGNAGVYRAAVGIDLGTTTSAVAVAGPDGRPVVVEDEAGRAVIPSVVFIQQDGRVLVGEAAAAAAEADPANAFYGVKRLMGRSYREALAEADDESAAGQGGAPSPSSAAASDTTRQQPHTHAHTQPHRQRLSGLRSYGLVEGPGGGVELACPALGRTLTPPEVSAHLLRHLADRAAAFLERRRAEHGSGGGVQVLDAVITVPANYSPSQRAAVMAAARAAGLQRVTLLQEPIAAALAYGFGSPQVPYDVLLVFDLGGGTLDLSIVEAFEGIMEVLATSGDNRLGGDDFTAALADWLAAQAQAPAHASQGPQGSVGTQAAQPAQPTPLALFLASEKAKLQLSKAAAATAGSGSSVGGGGGGVKGAVGQEVSVRVRLPCGNGGGDGSSGKDAAEREVELTQSRFQELVRPLMRRLWWPLERLAVATRTQLGGRLPPELDLRRNQDEGQVPCANSETAAAPDARTSIASSSSVTGSSTDLDLAEGPGRREGAAAWAFSIFPAPSSSPSSSSSSSAESAASLPSSASAAASAAGQPSKYVAPPRRLTGVVLVGAATRLPVIRDYITQVTGLPVRPGVDPETAVALGAALHAGLMVGAVGGGIEMNDGGYVADQHGRTAGFQTDAATSVASAVAAASEEQGELIWEP